MSCLKQRRNLNLTQKGIKALYHVENLTNQGHRESNLSFNIKMKEGKLLKPAELHFISKQNLLTDVLIH